MVGGVGQEVVLLPRNKWMAMAASRSDFRLPPPPCDDGPPCEYMQPLYEGEEEEEDKAGLCHHSSVSDGGNMGREGDKRGKWRTSLRDLLQGDGVPSPVVGQIGVGRWVLLLHVDTGLS